MPLDHKSRRFSPLTDPGSTALRNGFTVYSFIDSSYERIVLMQAAQFNVPINCVSMLNKKFVISWLSNRWICLLQGEGVGRRSGNVTLSEAHETFAFFMTMLTQQMTEGIIERKVGRNGNWPTCNTATHFR